MFSVILPSQNCSNSVNVVRFAFKWSIPNNTTADSQSLRFTGNNYALKCTVKCWLLARLQPVGALRNPLHYSPVMRTQRMENADVSRSSCRRVLFASLKAPLLNQQHFLCCFGGALKSSSEGASSAGRAEQQLSLSLAFTGIVAQSVLLMFFAFYPQSQTNDSREERWNCPAGTVVSSLIWHKWIKIIRAGGGVCGGHMRFCEAAIKHLEPSNCRPPAASPCRDPRTAWCSSSSQNKSERLCRQVVLQGVFRDTHETLLTSAEGFGRRKARKRAKEDPV